MVIGHRLEKIEKWHYLCNGLTHCDKILNFDAPRSYELH